MRPRVLFQGSVGGAMQAEYRKTTPEQLAVAAPMAAALGSSFIRRGLDIILTGPIGLDADLGAAAVSACTDLGVDPRERIRSYPHGPGAETRSGFGMVLHAADRRWQEVRTFVVQEADAVVALAGGKGTSDCVQKAVLARKPVFPVERAGGAAAEEWERLRASGYFNAERGDLDFLADRTTTPAELAERISDQIIRLVRPRSPGFSRRIFLVHGHDSALKNELARLLDRLNLVPVILAEEPERGQALLSKLHSQLADVGYAFIMLTPDDFGGEAGCPGHSAPRPRQNVIFEHGLLLGLLGPDRVCAIVKGEIELPSDIAGVVTKRLGPAMSVDAIALDLVKELRAAGYELDANRLLGNQGT